MDRETLLNLVVQTRKRAEQCDAAIAAQLGAIRELEREGADVTNAARGKLATLIGTRDTEIATMVRLLDELDEKPIEGPIFGSPLQSSA
jgi:hypothetical protein